VNLLSLILFIVAAVMFLIAAWWGPTGDANGAPGRPGFLVALGLCVLTVGFMAQFLIAPTIGAGH
jgi:hypothetical protein